ncbi:MAG: DNA-binding protein [Candidatus Odinarchaeota archaeon]
MSDEELETIRKRKLLSLQQQAEAAALKEEEQAEYERQKVEVLRKILSPEARSRLTNIKMVKPQIAEQIELQLINLAQTGQLTRAGIRVPISDEEFKMILSRIQAKKRDINIRFK